LGTFANSYSQQKIRLVSVHRGTQSTQKSLQSWSIILTNRLHVNIDPIISVRSHEIHKVVYKRGTNRTHHCQLKGPLTVCATNAHQSAATSSMSGGYDSCGL
jgi:hypothetical protein